MSNMFSGNMIMKFRFRKKREGEECLLAEQLLSSEKVLSTKLVTSA
jgi:hypothetical protein